MKTSTIEKSGLTTSMQKMVNIEELAEYMTEETPDLFDDMGKTFGCECGNIDGICGCADDIDTVNYGRAA